MSCGSTIISPKNTRVSGANPNPRTVTSVPPITGPWSGCSCVTVKGGSITASDVIVGVDFVFKGGGEPAPCAAVADVDCSGDVTASDLIYIVAHLFKGGPLPCDVCTLFPDVWDCP